MPAESGGGGGAAEWKFPPPHTLPASSCLSRIPESSDRLSSIQLDGSDMLQESFQVFETGSSGLSLSASESSDKGAAPSIPTKPRPWNRGRGARWCTSVNVTSVCGLSSDFRGDLKGEPCIGLDELSPEEVRHP